MLLMINTEMCFDVDVLVYYICLLLHKPAYIWQENYTVFLNKNIKQESNDRGVIVSRFSLIRDQMTA